VTVTPTGIIDRLRLAAAPLRRDRALIAAAHLFDRATALEPGGPSTLFGRRGLVPVYPHLAALDTLDYAERTIWSGAIDFEIEPRRRLVGEAGQLCNIDDGAYDAVLASHVLEHIADPIGALCEWQRVVRPRGHVLLVMPHREGTFDHARPVTQLSHMRDDAKSATGEDDLTHLEEVLRLHDLDRDPGAPNRALFEQRCRQNLSTRAMHHHVFDSRAVVELCKEAGLQVLLLRPKLPLNIVCLCRSGATAGGLSEREVARILARSPFQSDRR
jgi:hypothetical protein